MAEKKETEPKQPKPFPNNPTDETRTAADRAEIMADLAILRFFHEMDILEEAYDRSKEIFNDEVEEFTANGKKMNWFQKMMFRNNAITSQWKHLEKVANVSSFKVHPRFKNVMEEKDEAKRKMQIVRERFEKKQAEWEQGKKDFDTEQRAKTAAKKAAEAAKKGE